MARGNSSRHRLIAVAALACAAISLPGGRAAAQIAPDPIETDTIPPATRITAGPAPSTVSNRATFRFTAGEPATFECKLDAGKWHACKSKKVVTVAKGRHTFRVRATDEAGNRDPKPASYSWRVASHSRLTL